MFHSQLIIAPLFLLLSMLCAPEAGAAPAAISKVITVNLNGAGADHTTIQDAVNAIPDGSNEWVKIQVAAGIYKEKVLVNYTKGNIFLEGEGAHNTSIEWGDYNDDPAGHNTVTSATFTSDANNFVASRIAIKNTYDCKKSGVSQAVAALVTGDKSAFYGCSFHGVQDTLFDLTGRHYYKDCYIEGIIDVIFGEATSLYEGCTISTVRMDNNSGAGFITANSRDAANETSGFVFKDCSVTGKQAAYLGRAWRSHARVIFYRTVESDVVVPQGWSAWDIPPGQQSGLTFVEFECSGPGSNISERVKWLKKPNEEELKPFINVSFIDKEGWINAQPSSS